ncbi:MAG: TrkH family potassium uptake protein [Kiloniellales bacterium]
MIDYRPILFICGLLMATLAAAMVIPAVVDAAVGNPDWQVFTASAVVTLFIGVSLILTNRTRGRSLNLRQAFVLTTMAWIVIAAFGALPFAFSELELTYPNAFFEAMSGITTTGSTVIVGLDYAPPGILLWRALLQWLGGIGIIVMAVAVLPMLQVGGMQLFRLESSDKSEKAMPRATEIAGGIGIIYFVLTLICAAAYGFAGMNGFEAITHAMTTIATGGFSTSDASIGYFGNLPIEWIAIVFMILGGMPFVLYLKAVRGDPAALLRDSQVRWFLSIIVIAVATLAVYHGWQNGVPPLEAVRHTAFNAVSIMTGTGYVTTDFGLWGHFAMPAFVFLMFIGGCAGSTTCGIKIFRFQVLYATARTQALRLVRPHGVFIAYYNGKPIPDTVAESVMSFFFVFVLCFGALALGLGVLGLDFLTAVSGAATAIANVGPGLGEVIGPSATFATLPDAAKWLLSAGMLLGRLELFTVLVLFAPSFWRR